MKKFDNMQWIASLVGRLTLAIAFLGFATAAMAQQRLAGRVTDAAGNPVIGASVVVEGTTNGTTTGVDGSFALNVPDKAAVTVSFIGYKSVQRTCIP